MSASAAPVKHKKTIRGLLGSLGDVAHGASARLLGPSSEPSHSSKQSGALSHLITLKPEAPFCVATAMPVRFPSPVSLLGPVRCGSVLIRQEMGPSNYVNSR